MRKWICAIFVLLAGVSSAELLLFSDTFDAPNCQDINTNLVSRQSGTQATAEWNDSAGNNWTTQIEGGTMRLYKAGAGSIVAELDTDFATVADDVRISVDMQLPNGEAGFTMVNFGMAAADGFNANAGYSFRLDNRTGDFILSFHENGVRYGHTNVTAYTTNVNTLVIQYEGGNTISAAFNDWQYVFTAGGTTSYTGAVESENRIMLGWYGDGDPSMTSVKYDNFSVVAEQVPSFPAAPDLTGPNLISNGDFSSLANQTPVGASMWNLTGTFGDFSGATNCTADLVSWLPYYADPNSLIAAVGTPHVIDGDGELDGTYYLDTHINGDTVVLNSSMDYRNGLKQENILNGAVIDSGSTYQLTVDALSPSWNTSESVLTVALTTGTGADVTNTANAVSGTFQEVAVSGLSSEFSSAVAVQVSGADLLAAQSNGQVNVIFDHVNGTAIPGFPGSVESNDVKNISLVSQVQIDSVSLYELFETQEGDLNKDGVVNQDDADLAQDYLDGNGGLSAADRVASLIDDGMTTAEALAALNLTDFDLDGDGDFDGDDVSAVASLFPTILNMLMAGASMDFEWVSRSLKQYHLETCTSLTDPDWTNYNDGVMTYENILASETGTNTLSGVLTDGSVRFFRLVEEAGPTSFIGVSAGSFEDPAGASGSWSPMDAVWNPTTTSLYQVNKGTTHFSTTPDGEWMALIGNVGAISQDLVTTVNAGDTLTVTFSSGNAKSSSSTTGGGVFNAVFRVGATAYTMAVDTTGLDPDTWQTYTNTVTVSNSGSLSIEFATVSGKPWLDNISDVTRTEPQ